MNLKCCKFLSLFLFQFLMEVSAWIRCSNNVQIYMVKSGHLFLLAFSMSKHKYKSFFICLSVHLCVFWNHAEYECHGSVGYRNSTIMVFVPFSCSFRTFVCVLKWRGGMNDMAVLVTEIAQAVHCAISYTNASFRHTH